MRTTITFKYSQPSHTPSSFSLQNPLFLLLGIGIYIFFAPVVAVAEQVFSEIAGTASKYKENKTITRVFLQGSSSFIQITKQFHSFASTAEETGCCKAKVEQKCTELIMSLNFVHKSIANCKDHRKKNSNRQLVNCGIHHAGWGGVSDFGTTVSFIRYCFHNDFLTSPCLALPDVPTSKELNFIAPNVSWANSQLIAINNFHCTESLWALFHCWSSHLTN